MAAIQKKRARTCKRVVADHSLLSSQYIFMFDMRNYPVKRTENQQA